MTIEITMPRLSDTMEEGTLIKWRVAVGDRVRVGDLLADVETDKATMELQAFDDGAVAELAIGEGQSVPVGTRILLLDDGGGGLSVTPEDVADTQTGVGAEPSPATPGGDAAPTAPGGRRPRVSPLARKIAEEHGLDLGVVRGTGPAGRIIKRDVLAAIGPGPPPETLPSSPAPTATPLTIPPAATAPSPAKPSGGGGLQPVSGMRKTIARRLVESKTTIPHFTVTVTVDMAPLLALRAGINEQLAALADPIKLSVTDMITRATALALLQHPLANASWTDEGILQHDSVHIGVAVALPPEKGGGLVVPVIHDAHNQSVRAISAQVRALAQKARTTGLSPQDMADGTFTISNLGMYGVEHFEAIINPPQAAILAVGSTIEKPVVRQGRIEVGRVLACTLSADHRVLDGTVAAQFLQTLRQMLENPAVLLV